MTDHLPGGAAPAVLVVQNTPTGGPGRLGDWLRAAGVSLELVRAHAGEPVPERLGRRSLIMLGGGWLPDDDTGCPWLPAVRRLTTQALDGGNPMLGICLGGQLLAHVAGGTVKGRHGEPEHGSTPIRLRAEAREDVLFAGLPAVTPVIEHHVDAITDLPRDAVWLATSDSCPYQAFRVGERAWGVQFHPEADAERVRGWDPRPLRERGLDPDRLYERALADESASAAAWRAFGQRLARLVTHRS